MPAAPGLKWIPLLGLVGFVVIAGITGQVLRHRDSSMEYSDEDYSDSEDYPGTDGHSDTERYSDDDSDDGSDDDSDDDSDTDHYADLNGGRAAGSNLPAYDSSRPSSGQGGQAAGRSRSDTQGTQRSMAMQQGPCFRYAVPEGWHVVEDGQFAVVLMAQDQRAITTLVGNVGLPLNYNPQQYLYEKLSQTGLGNLRFGPGRQAPAVFGFPSAWEFDVDYDVSGLPCRGLARCSVAPSYDFCTMVMTWAASEASQWPNYASWLPGVAGQVQVTNSAAFGASGIAAQNLQNSVALGEKARQYREESAQQWNDATNGRGESQDRNNAAFRENLGAVQSYYNPYENRAVELPTSNTVYWINPTTGRIVGDPSPSYDPRTPTDSNWQPLESSRN